MIIISYHLVNLFQVDKIIDNVGGDGEIDHPVHEVEGEEGDGEHDPAVLVNITGLVVIGKQLIIGEKQIKIYIELFF